MNKIIFLLAATCLQASLVTGVFAADNADSKGKVIDKPVAADTPEKFAQTADAIRSEMGPSGRYEFIKLTDKAKVEADLNSMAAMLQKAGSVSAMSEREKVSLFNTQERVNGLLTHSDSNRLVCERRAPVGSNIPINTCKTVGEIEKERRDGQKLMQDQQAVGQRSLLRGG